MIATTKSCEVRPVLLVEPRCALTFDMREADSKAEYVNLVRHFGGEPIRFATDGTWLNPLDLTHSQLGAAARIKKGAVS